MASSWLNPAFLCRVFCLNSLPLIHYFLTEVLGIKTASLRLKERFFYGKYFIKSVSFIKNKVLPLIKIIYEQYRRKTYSPFLWSNIIL